MGAHVSAPMIGACVAMIVLRERLRLGARWRWRAIWLRLTLWHTFGHSVKHGLQHRCVMKVLENRLRRMAERQGFVLEKSRRRDPKAKDYGLYRLLPDHRDLEQHRAETEYTLSQDEVKSFLGDMEDALNDD